MSSWTTWIRRTTRIALAATLSASAIALACAGGQPTPLLSTSTLATSTGQSTPSASGTRPAPALPATPTFPLPGASPTTPAGRPQLTATPAQSVTSATTVRPATSLTATASIPATNPSLAFPGMALDLKQGDFWDFRWTWQERSCAQRSGCSTDEQSGLFRVMLGLPSTISGVQMFQVTVSGERLADNGDSDLAPTWAYLGADGPLLLGSMGSSNAVLFDARTGRWQGGGFFSRFRNNEDHAASKTSIATSDPLAAIGGFRPGPAISVVRSDSQTLCKIIEGFRICPNQQEFSLSETQYYRDTVGPTGYSYHYSASFSGGGFSSSVSSEEHVALVASSLSGDAPTTLATPTAAPSPTPPAPALQAIVGPVEDALLLNSSATEIPDFKTGVVLAEGAVEVTFVNPDVPGGAWSYGVTFRHSQEETFHAVYVAGDGTWEHFVRSGSAESEKFLGGGRLAINATAGSRNTLRVVFGSAKGQFYLNGKLVGELGLPAGAASAPGDVRVMTGIRGKDVFNGARVEFIDLVVSAPASR